jgi:CHAT domain-containing protein
VRFGASASEGFVLKSMGDFDLVHIAAHGLVDFQDPSRTALVLAGDTDHDGLLTVTDIVATRVKADLVVVAACDSAGGAWRGGEGHLSMARAFLMAGAGSVVASLWPVDDTAAVPVVVGFHRQIAQGDLSVPEALRAAKLDALQHTMSQPTAARGSPIAEPPPRPERMHPYYWAALVYIGPPF